MATAEELLLTIKTVLDDGGVEALQKSLDKMNKTNKAASKSPLESLRALKIGWFAAGAAALKALQWIGKGIKGAADKARSEAVLAASVKNNFGVAGTAADLMTSKYKKAADALEDVTGIDDAQVMKTFAGFAAAGVAAKDIERLGQVSADVAAGTGRDFQGTATLLQRVYTAPLESLGALSRIGIKINAEQLKGLTTEQQRTKIMDELAKRYSGMAAEAYKADGGIAKFEKQLENLAEEIGKTVIPVLSTLIDAIGILGKVGSAIDGAFSVDIGDKVMKWQLDKQAQAVKEAWMGVRWELDKTANKTTVAFSQLDSIAQATIGKMGLTGAAAKRASASIMGDLVSMAAESGRAVTGVSSEVIRQLADTALKSGEVVKSVKLSFAGTAADIQAGMAKIKAATAPRPPKKNEYVAPVARAVGNAVDAADKKIEEKKPMLIETIAGIAREASNAFTSFMEGDIKGAVFGIADSLGAAFGPAGTAAVEIGKSLYSIGEGIVDVFVETAEEKFEKLVKQVQRLLDDITAATGGADFYSRMFPDDKAGQVARQNQIIAESLKALQGGNLFENINVDNYKELAKVLPGMMDAFADGREATGAWGQANKDLLKSLGLTANDLMRLYDLQKSGELDLAGILTGIADAEDAINDIKREGIELTKEEALESEKALAAKDAKMQELLAAQTELERNIETGAVRGGTYETTSRQADILNQLISRAKEMGLSRDYYYQYEEQLAGLLQGALGEQGFAAAAGTGAGVSLPGIPGGNISSATSTTNNYSMTVDGQKVQLPGTLWKTIVDQINRQTNKNTLQRG